MKLRNKLKLQMSLIAVGCNFLIVVILFTMSYFGLTIAKMWGDYGFCEKLFVIVFLGEFCFMVYFAAFSPKLKLFDRFYGSLTEAERMDIDAAVEDMLNEKKTFVVTDFAFVNYNFVNIVSFKFADIERIRYNNETEVVTF